MAALIPLHPAAADGILQRQDADIDPFPEIRDLRKSLQILASCGKKNISLLPGQPGDLSLIHILSARGSVPAASA